MTPAAEKNRPFCAYITCEIPMCAIQIRLPRGTLRVGPEVSPGLEP